jgi:aspartyl-tRNA(Asn)/glutamyl-tRNA(Gln) amidotransferase subunit C
MVSDSRDSSPVGPEVVRKVAALARLRLPEEDLSAWTGQLGRILSYIGQLERVPAADLGGPGPGTPDLHATPLRQDRSEAGGGAEALAANEPHLVHGYGSVPRVVGSS